ncbi:MAG: ORF6N domain-containing protein [Acidobacteria bacterium]|nr:ORF6N domain-containing protein [Acidobacteriota bacterium]
MLDSELAALYGVETKMLTRAVRRNNERFPDDFMFQVTTEEFEDLKRQIGASSSRNYGGRRYMPYVFTEQGVAMLSSVLNSERAVQVNIAIMRAFVNMRKLAMSNEEVANRLAIIERKVDHHDENFKKVFGAIRAMLNPTPKPQKQIGYIQGKKKRS